MPREKTLFFIGIWIILLSNFIGLPTEIKNYLFIATALLIIVASYTFDISKPEKGENFFHKKIVEKEVPKPEIKKESIPNVAKTFSKPKHFTTLKKEEPAEEVKVEKEALIDLSNPFSSNPNSSYEPVIKVRRARIKPKPKLKPIKEEPPIIESSVDLNSEEDDVIVISSDGDSRI